MTMLRRGAWNELELRDSDDDLMLFHPGWTNDMTGLLLPLRETGWFSNGFEVRDALDHAVLSWGWVGVDDDLNLVQCSSGGEVLETGESVEQVVQVTLARFPRAPETG